MSGNAPDAITLFNGLGGYMTSTITLKTELDAATFIDPQYVQLIAGNPKLAAFAQGQ